jgi:hypothetical protein
VLAAAFVAAPLVGIGLESWDALKARREAQRIG